jgi:hypothetical protein
MTTSTAVTECQLRSDGYLRLPVLVNTCVVPLS